MRNWRRGRGGLHESLIRLKFPLLTNRLSQKFCKSLNILVTRNDPDIQLLNHSLDVSEVHSTSEIDSNKNYCLRPRANKTEAIEFQKTPQSLSLRDWIDEFNPSYLSFTVTSMASSQKEQKTTVRLL